MASTSTILDDIKRYIEDGEMSFLIGAGFSRNVNDKVYPLWGDLLKDGIWKLFGSGVSSKQEKNVIDKAVKEYGYLGIASMMVKQAGYHEAIDTYIEERTPYLKTESGKPELFLNGTPLHRTVNSDCHLLLKKLDILNIYTFVHGSWFRVHGSGFMVHGSGLMVNGSGFMVHGSGFRVIFGSGLRIKGA